MPIRKLTDSLYISPQLTEADVQEAVRLGIPNRHLQPPGRRRRKPTGFCRKCKTGLKRPASTNSHTSPSLRLKSTQPMLQPSKICCNNLRLLSLPSAVPALAAPCFGVSSSATRRICSEVVAAAEQAGVNLSNFEARLQEAKDKGLA